MTTSIYFEKSLTKDDNPKLFLELYSSLFNFNISGLLLIDKKEVKQLEIYDKESLISQFSYNLENIIELKGFRLLNPTYNFISGYNPKNGMIIPIFKSLKIIGYLFFLNNTSDFDEKIIKNMSECIYIAQNIFSHYHKRNNTRDLFIANVSHEIRTPLNGIVGYSQLLAQTSLDLSQKTFVTSINQCSIQLMQIINDILDYSKLASGKMKIKHECFSIKELLDNVMDAVSYKLKEKRLIYKTIIDKNIPDYIITDKQKIIQVIVNLLSNSIKFTESGGSIELSILKKENNQIYISVKDTGIGISEQDQKNIFNEYSQGNELISTKYGGTGLGLSICKKICELLNGNISFTSQLGKGSEFSFMIKYTAYEEEETKIVKKSSAILNNKYVLVVDDNSSNRVILSEILFEWGMQPISCASAFEAIRLIAGNRYNFEVALIDICMPVTNGFELAKQIKLENPKLPLIALSSLDDAFSKTESIDFEDKLFKPINKVQLYQTLEKIIGDNKISPKVEKKMDYEFKKRIPKILIAEDVVYNQTLLENMLQSIGYNDIKSVSNGIKVIDELKRDNSYNILLLDLRMPEMDGFEVIERLKKLSINITIIPVTASVIDEDRERCKELGVTSFLTKPIDIRQLKNLLQEF